MADERIWQDIRTAPREGLHYFSTVIVRKRGMEMRPAAFS
jgi:precorrin-2 methylase